MKNIFSKTILFGAAILGLASCNFLQVEIVGKSDIDTFFAEASSLESAMYGVYHETFGLYDSYMLKYPEVAGDEIVLNPTESSWIQCHNFSLTSSDEATVLAYIWKGAYNVINNCNEILHYGPKLLNAFPNQAETTSSWIAQALFIRALMHFDLCRSYAQDYAYSADASHLGVVVMDHIPSLSETISRTSVADVYKQIVKDLNDALDTFPEGSGLNVNFVSPLACKALLARVYLYMGQWEEAASAASEVIGKVPLVDRSAYKAMFCTRTPSADESIFRLNGNLQGHSLYNFYYYENPSARPSARVRDLMASDDIRASILDYSATYPNIAMKYTCLDDVTTDEERYYNPIILRVSEMYLIRAEANCNLGFPEKSEEDIKTLQARARGKSATEISLNWTDAASMEKIIEEERVRELCFEGHRFFDLARRHQNIERTSDTQSSVSRLNYPDYRFALPIPAVELEANHDMQPNPDSND